MANNFITWDKGIKLIKDSIDKSADKYQIETGCSDEEKNKLAFSVACSIAPPFYGIPSP